MKGGISPSPETSKIAGLDSTQVKVSDFGEVVSADQESSADEGCE
jgi:hypothetical protein